MFSRVRFFVVLFCLLCSARAFAQFNEPHVELEWYTIETPHFFVNYHEGTERTARIVAAVAEDVYGPITSFYGHKPDTKVSFIIKDVADYSNGAAYYFDNKIEIWANPLDFDLRGTHNWLRNVVSHEFTHIVQSQVAMKFSRRLPAIYLQAFGYEAERRPDVLSGYPNLLISYPILGAIVPAWFSEGTAQYNRPLFGYETWDAHRDMLLRMRALDDKLLSFPEMATFGKTTLGNESSYNQGFALTSYIAGQFGEEKLQQISANMQKPFATSIDGAIEQSTGVPTSKLFKDWSGAIKQDYETRVAPIKANRREGDTLDKQIGYMNLYPSFSPDGKKVAYISNKTSDYTAEYIYVVDLATLQEEHIPTEGSVYSRVQFSHDGTKLLYARRSPGSIYGDRFFDVYEYDLFSKKEHRLTYGERAIAPAYSKDESEVYAVTIHDGTSNLVKIPRGGGKPIKLTNFTNGEQLYHPIISWDGKNIYFDFAERDQREIASIDGDGKNFTLLTDKGYDVRSPFLLDSNTLLVSSNKTGIFNVYALNLRTKSLAQLTNVLGGAFMPTASLYNDSLDLVFSDYTSDGYVIHRLKTTSALRDTAFTHSEYIFGNRDRFGNPRPPLAITSLRQKVQGDSLSNYEALRAYNDLDTARFATKPYQNIYNGISFIPVLRYDNYNPNSKGLDNLWAGLYAMSSDITGRLSLSAGAVINKNFERDLFAGVSQYSTLFRPLGFFPMLELSVANSTRKPGTLEEAGGGDTVQAEYSINFLTFDAGITHPIFSSEHYIKLGYTYSIYTSRVEQAFFPNQQVTVPSSSDDYFKGGDLSLSYWTNQLAATRTHDINPVGWYTKLRLDWENNKLLRGRSVENGLPKLNYQDYSYLRFEGHYDHAWNIFSQYDAFGVHGRVGAIFPMGATAFPIDSFFHFYGGGVAGLRGYPYYALSGTHLASVQARYYFPISNGLDFRLLQFYFDKLYVGVFGDAAVIFAMDDSTSLTSKFKSEVQHNLRTDIGAELRLESFSWYSVPTDIFFSVAYGLNQFDFRARRNDGTLTNVTYGKELRYYAGILFTFDFSQPFSSNGFGRTGMEAHKYLGSALNR